MAASTSCGILVTGPHVLLGHAACPPRRDIPKGLADPGEALATAAARELREETGLLAAPYALVPTSTALGGGAAGLGGSCDLGAGGQGGAGVRVEVQHGSPLSLAQAQIMLSAAAGLENKAVCVEVGADASTVGKWRRRFAEHRHDGLLDEPRPGTPRRISDDEIADTIRW